MKCFQIGKPLLFLVLSLFFPNSEPLPNNEQSCVPQSISTSTKLRCGEVLTASSGFISYKPYHPIDKNERCVWTLSSQEFTLYEFDILYLGFPNNNETVTTQPSLILNTVPYRTTDMPEIYIPTSTGVFGISESTLIITFSSDQLEDFNDYTGFILQYKRSNTSPGSQLQHQIVMPRVMVNFKAEGYNIDGTIVFPPENNTYPGIPYPIVYMEHGSINCRANCYTKLSVYHFDRSNTTVPWQQVDGFCCRQETTIIPGHDDLWMITVSSGGDYYEQIEFDMFNERCRS